MTNTILRTNRDKILRAMQDIELELLIEFDRICRKHDINYSLGGGTCLGQVRHGGFIPWDDDIDIDMTVENYDKFLKVAPTELDNNKYYLRCRMTDKNRLRSYMRIERRGTYIGMTRYSGMDYDPNIGVFIDIFRLNYLPNNEKKRKKVSNILFFIRALEEYKEVRMITKDLPKNQHIPVMLLSKILSGRTIIRIEEKIVKKYGTKKTNWITSDSLMNGNYGGHSSLGIDEYANVDFEGVCVMNKANTETFLTTLYGSDYMNWLSPKKRISNHMWTDIDLGEYAEYYDLPDEYSKYIVVKMNDEKLVRMMELSEEIVDWIDDTCKRVGCIFFRTEDIQKCNYNEDGRMWSGPVKLVMLRDDYELFEEYCINHPNNKYIYQSKTTDRDFNYTHARIRLNNTTIRERSIPYSLENRFNKGLFVDIIPLDYAPKDEKKRKKLKRKVRRLNRSINLKWRKGMPRQFFQSGLKTKIRLVLMMPVNIDMMHQRLKRVIRNYNKETDVFIDGTGVQLNGLRIEKTFESMGYKFDGSTSGQNSPQNYDELIKTVHKKFSYCHLNFYDNPEYQLSMMRYDNVTGRLMTNEEILGE